ncbi:uncharacterized protein [Oryza sativa Japonica Group]|uniref:Os07g0136300 protein n=4 Tax=Oryza TaxID=4527 RepID=Q6ZE36_ORYSJ|nr:uncharacterized protein LOC4342352 [Oryza sativa Japonica Group]EAZ02694.1 hypothetical protein OsI_24809 [Oryza sativa Indica Group]KAB8104250.1 hypothetical protein EE612_037002 [Oryza sativa]EAZ38619.1 hypothetical protein OsJ_23009 [Oryza sativa Japonica Group]KAF2921353.1 hypothetical protein DAI22_07g025800 [Oryza sativa Japonica Group]BAC83464.1 unknown protein [Oryza sativa Japonica Group]|eukprot:NP_001058847.1 Os07g0136300 [Oryza sativa Japonica Group]
MAAVALRSLARKAMPAPATLRRAPPPSRSLHRHSLEDKLRGTTSPKTTAPTDQGRVSYFEENPELFAELVKRDAARRMFTRLVLAGAASAYAGALFVVSSMRDSVKEELRKNIYD